MTNEKRCEGCDDKDCSAHDRRPGESDHERENRQALAARMCRIRHKVMVLSGKGGVGKSTVAVNLATSMAMAGKKVGLLDIDIHGPSVPKLLHVDGVPMSGGDNSLDPVIVDVPNGSLRVMSIGFMLRNRDDAVIWRGPLKFTAIRQFLQDVEWGELDYLVIDSPPGTGDEPLTVAQLIDDADGAVIVTTPQELAVQDVRRCITFCRQLNLPILGVVENMSGFVCPKCGEHFDLFGSGGGREMAEQMHVPYLGSVPIEGDVVRSGDAGTPLTQAYPRSKAAEALGRIARKLIGAENPEASTLELPVGEGLATRIEIT